MVDNIKIKESVHTHFYRSVARFELEKSDYAQKIARFVVEKFWNPVGSGVRSKDITDYTIAMLFGDEPGIEWIDQAVTSKV